MSIETDLQKIFSADVKPYIAARNQKFRAQDEADKVHAMTEASVKPAFDRMRAAIVRAMKPHNVEWLVTYPLGISYDSQAPYVHFEGNIWPATKARKGYSMHARPFVRMSFTPRDADEFHRVVAMLKAMADAATEAGL